MWWKSIFAGAVAVCLACAGVPSAAQDAPSTRTQWFLRGRTAAGQSAAELNLRAYQQKLKMRAAARSQLGTLTVAPRDFSTSGWSPLGPSPLCSDATGADQNCNGGQQNYNWVSGRATAVAVDPSDPSGNTVYVGGAQGGLWKSTNAGPLCSDPASVSWNAAPGSTGCGGSAQSSPLSLIDSQPSLTVGAIAVGNPNGQNVVLVGTGETNDAIDSYYGLGILRSLDGGNTWTQITQDAAKTHTFVGAGFSQIAFSTNTPGLVVAATAAASQGVIDSREPDLSNLGIYYSLDSGQSWTYASIADRTTPLGRVSVTSVVFDAAYNNNAGAFFAAIRFHGFYISPDGVSWTRLPNQPGPVLSATACPPSSTSNLCSIYRGVLSVVPGKNEMYAWFVDQNSIDQHVWQTLDGGSTWKQIDETGLTVCGDSSGDSSGGCGTANGTYNLTLAAVPDGEFTDIYAGAVNLYKCRLPSGQAGNLIACFNGGFLNLTHVNGCDPLGAPARVHPSQHAIDFLPINGGQQVVMYFANDGGIYRALDGYTGLLSNDCATPNQFDSLNQTLGSMTQFISLAQHPNDANTLLGGAEDNGTAATANALEDSPWVNVNSANGGYAAITVNPNSSAQWFTENTGVSIQSCSNGIACQAGDFTPVVTSATLGGDNGPLYTPYVIDPKNSSEMIVGTCRVWRGATSGAGFAALSPNFDPTNAAICTGNEVNMVRSLAVGGPLINGSSSVIYAGTDGTGPSAIPAGGGHVWVMTTASTGAITWTDRTQAINPDNYPISAIAIDPADPTGNTAYVGLMGFRTTHVWQTKNAGVSWNAYENASSGLPDIAINAVVVDDGTVYVGTDTGVFSSSTTRLQWVEAGAGASEFLPNVAVRALGVFSDGAIKLLRAATYGRGIWQFPLIVAPDFQLAVPDPEQTAFASPGATFSGTLSSIDGYGDQVQLNCAPAMCSPVLATPTPAGAPFTIQASGVVGDYNLALSAVGQDAASITRTVALKLHVVEVTLGAPSLATITLTPSQSSTPVSLQLGFRGTFPSGAVVQLACTAPLNVSCQFSPASVTPVLGVPVPVALTVVAGAGAPGGNFSLDIAATASADATETLHQQIALDVIAPTYSLALTGSTVASPSTLGSSIAATATSSDGYSGVVSLSCTTTVLTGPGPAPSCTVDPTVTPTPNGAGFNIRIGPSAAGSYSLNVQGTGNDANATKQNLQQTVYLYGFTVVPAATTQTVPAGQPATYSISVTPTGLANFQQPVTFACAPLTCSFSPPQLNPGDAAQTVQLTVSTTTSMAWSGVKMKPQARALLYAMLLPGTAFLLICAGCGKSPRRQSLMCIILGSVVVFVLLQAGCGGGLTGGGSGSTVPPPTQGGGSSNTFPFTVSITEGNGQTALQQQTSLTLVVNGASSAPSSSTSLPNVTGQWEFSTASVNGIRALVEANLMEDSSGTVTAGPGQVVVISESNGTFFFGDCLAGQANAASQDSLQATINSQGQINGTFQEGSLPWSLSGTLNTQQQTVTGSFSPVSGNSCQGATNGSFTGSMAFAKLDFSHTYSGPLTFASGSRDSASATLQGTPSQFTISIVLSGTDNTTVILNGYTVGAALYATGTFQNAPVQYWGLLDGSNGIVVYDQINRVVLGTLN